jgi:hypothetical protein
LHQLRYSVSRNSEGQYQLSRAVNRDPQTYSRDGKDIPQKDRLTIDGETLYYRVTKTLKVLDDALEQKIPSLEDLRDSMSDSTGVPPSSVPSPASSTHLGATNPHPAAPVQTPPGTSAETAVSITSEAADAGRLLQQFGWPGGTRNDQNIAQLRRWMDDNGLKEIEVATLINARQYSPQRRDAAKSLHLAPTYSRDPAGVALQQYCWPGGVKNGQNIAALQQWMTDNGLGSVDVVIFIHAADYAAQRQSAVLQLHLSDKFAKDAAAIALQQYCWPGGVKNDQNLAALREWMDANSLAALTLWYSFIALNSLGSGKPRSLLFACLNLPFPTLWELSLRIFAGLPERRTVRTGIDYASG